VALAWWLYVNDEPRPYHLSPVSIAVKGRSKAGNEYIQQADDYSSITRFPLSAFLATNEGYIVRARLTVEKVIEAREKHGPRWPNESNEYRELWYMIEKAVVAMRKKVGSLKTKWGAAEKLDEETVEN
jgi:hypothetical protein